MLAEDASKRVLIVTSCFLPSAIQILELRHLTDMQVVLLWCRSAQAIQFAVEDRMNGVAMRTAEAEMRMTMEGQVL